jgi:hypothetical protein
MNARNEYTAAKRLRGWWLSPPRSGMQRLISPWEYRHLRAFGVTRVAGASVAAAAGIVCLSYGVYGWAAFFLVVGALNLAAGYWYLSIAPYPPARNQVRGGDARTRLPSAVAGTRNKREASRPQS